MCVCGLDSNYRAVRALVRLGHNLVIKVVDFIISRIEKRLITTPPTSNHSIYFSTLLSYTRNADW